MKIDVFPHILPPRFFGHVQSVVPAGSFMMRRLGSLPVLYDLDRRFALMDRYGDYVQVLTLGMPIEGFGLPDRSPDLARRANDEMADLVARHPGRFVGFVASLPMDNPEEAQREVDRTVTEMGADGVMVFTNVNGRPLDEPPLLAVLERAAQLGVPIWLHPIRPGSAADYPGERRSKYELWWTLGWPYETSVAMGRMVYSGLFDRHPNCAVIAHHLGGLVPYLAGRLGMGQEDVGTRSEDPDDLAAVRRLRGRPLDYFKRFYGDTAVFGDCPEVLECGLAFFGADRVLFATDMPFDPEGGEALVRETLAGVERMRIGGDVREAIYEGNARRLLGARLR